MPALQRRIKKMFSGGQSGADRAALDWAIAHEIPHGGWCPKGRIAEDGVLDQCYRLQETESGSYRQRTKLNVRDSDGTLIVNLGILDGGSLETLRFAEKLGKPHLVVQLDDEVQDQHVTTILAWLRKEDVDIVNIAGPRESKRPGIYAATTALLDAIENSRC